MIDVIIIMLMRWVNLSYSVIYQIDKLIEQGEEIFKSEIGYLLYPLGFILNKIYLEGKKSVLINDKLIYDLHKNINEVGLIIEKIELLFREQELKKEKEAKKEVVKTNEGR